MQRLFVGRGFVAFKLCYRSLCFTPLLETPRNIEGVWMATAGVYPNRYIRFARLLKNLPRRWWIEYPEQCIYAGTYGLVGVSLFIYKSCVYGLWGQRGELNQIWTVLFTTSIFSAKPYYRNSYQVVRPDDISAIRQRPPEVRTRCSVRKWSFILQDYPPPYLSNRENEYWYTYNRDYGYNAKQ